MNRGPRALLVVCVAIATSDAAAQNLYSCRDHAGHTITSDRPITECAGVMRELGPTGVLRREIAPPLTAEQTRQKEIDDKLRRDTDEAAREKRRRDSALLAAYSNEEAIEAARRRSLADADDSIRGSKARIEELMKDRRTLVQDGEVYKGKLPPLYQRKLDDNQALIDDEQASMKMRQADVERINQRYNEEVRRYRDLTSSNKAAVR